MSENNGRDDKGRFVKGNPGGPGNPFARQMAEFRVKLMEAVRPDDIEAITFSLVLQARIGNLEAIKLLFSYIMGKPNLSVDPDRLDHHEFELHKNGRTTALDIEKALDNMPVKDAIDYVRLPREAFIQRELEKGEERRRKKAERQLRKKEARRMREVQLACPVGGGYSSLEEEMGITPEEMNEHGAEESNGGLTEEMKAMFFGELRKRLVADLGDEMVPEATGTEHESMTAFFGEVERRIKASKEAGEGDDKVTA